LSSLNFLIWNHTVTSESNRILIVGMSLSDGNKTGLTVTYGGLPLTRIGVHNGSGSTPNRVELWYLINPPTGTAPIIVTLSGLVKAVGGSVSLSGVDQISPLGSFVSDHGTSNAPSVSVPSAPGDVIVDTFSGDGTVISATPGSGQAGLWNMQTGAGGGDVVGGGSVKPGGATATMSWTLGAGGRWALAAVPVHPATCTTGTAPSGPLSPSVHGEVAGVISFREHLVEPGERAAAIDGPVVTQMPEQNVERLPRTGMPIPIDTLGIIGTAILGAGVALRRWNE
jgi:hypothetical protein